jgi:hypothetical protein
LLDWVGADEWGLTGADSIATDPVDPNRVYVLAGTYTNSSALADIAGFRHSAR